MRSLLVIVLTLAACNPGPPDLAVTCANTSGDPLYLGVTVGGRYAACTFGPDDMTLRAGFTLPDGASLALGGKPWLPEAGKHLLAVGPWILGQPSSILASDSVKVTLPVVLNRDGVSEPVQFDIGLSDTGRLLRRLVEPLKAGRTLAATTGPRAEPPTVLVAGESEAWMLGEPARIADFDLVAIVEEHQDDVRMCEYGTLIGKDSDKLLVASVYTDTFVVYDARTAKEIARRTFPPGGPMPACPSVLRSDAVPTVESLTVHADRNTVKAWLEQVRTSSP